VRRGRSRLLLAAVVAMASAVCRGTASGAIASAAIPVFHGSLVLARGVGSFEQQSGAARFTVRHWRMTLADGSNGVFPSEEPIVIAVGADQFRLEPGALVADRRGRRFRHRVAKGAAARGILRLDIRERSATEYDLTFTLADVQLFPLTQSAPVCMPLAVIVGDDDGFSGVDFDRPGFPARVTRRLTVRREPCAAETWPWT
jgi:hypothetical protein